MARRRETARSLGCNAAASKTAARGWPSRIAEQLEARRLLTTFYVDIDSPTASDNNAGTSLNVPLKTITQALNLISNHPATVQSDTVYISPGTYYEQPNVWLGDGGVSATNPTVISAYVNPATGQYEPVYINAAQPASGMWTEVGSGPIWYLSDFTTETSGVWVDWSGGNDGPGLQQIGSYGDGYADERNIVGAGVSDMYAGTYYGDAAESRLYVWLSDGSNPSSHAIEYASNGHAIYQPGAPIAGGGYAYASNVDFVGLDLRHVNAYSTYGQDAGSAIYTVNNDSLISCDIEENGETGVILRGSSQMVDCISSNNGGNGVAAQGSGFLISGGQYDGNYWRQYTDGSNAGIKVISNVPTLFGNIENTQVENNDGQGIWFDTCFQNSVISQITGNYVYDNQGAGIDLESSRNYLVANNVIVGNHADGIALNAVENASVDNNTIVGNYGVAAVELDGGTRDQGNVYPGTVGMFNNTVENNILANNYADYDLDIPTIAAEDNEINNNTADYNLFYRRGGALHFTTGGTYLGSWGSTPSTLIDWQADSEQDLHSIVADPSFLSGSYQLGIDSPALGAGVNLYSKISTDYTGNARPSQSGFAIGAFEYAGGGMGTAGSVITNTDPMVWVDDQLPDDSAMTEPDSSDNSQENRFWIWNSSNAYSGAASLDSGAGTGAHRQYFSGANPRLVGQSDTLFAYVWIDPANLPQEIMLEWQDSSGAWAHQAYWGANVIPSGVDGSVAGQDLGMLPVAGEWALLAVPAASVGLAGVDITGFSFDVYGGRALLDKVGNGAAPAANQTLNIDSGTYIFGISPRTDNPNLTVNVARGATVKFESPAEAGNTDYNLAALNLAPGANAVIAPSDSAADRTVLVLSSLMMQGQGSLLDVGNNAVIVRNGDPLVLTQLLDGGYDAGSWDGTGGIISAAAASDIKFLTAVGLAMGMSGTFNGALISPDDVLMQYTYYGDTNLDGQVDGSDYSRLDNGIISASTGWFNGDFNYDGVLDGSDYTLIDNSYNQQGASLLAQMALPAAMLAETLQRRDFFVSAPTLVLPIVVGQTSRVQLPALNFQVEKPSFPGVCLQTANVQTNWIWRPTTRRFQPGEKRFGDADVQIASTMFN